MTDAASVPNATDAAQSDRLAAWLCAAGLLITAFFGWISPDGLYHFDDLTHFLYAKWSWRWPAYLLNDWGRPGFTALYAPAAYFGWPMCRAVSALLSAFAAWMAYRIAQRAGMTRAWAVDTASPAGAARRNPGSQGLSIANENGWHGRGRWRPCSCVHCLRRASSQHPRKAPTPPASPPAHRSRTGMPASCRGR